MKQFMLLIILTAMVTITGCEKEKSKDKEELESIVGKWFIEQTIERQIENGVKTFEEIEADHDENDFFQFRADGGASNGEGDEYTYEITSDGNLILTEIDGSNVENYEIRKLTADELVIYIEDLDGPDSKETYEIYLKK